jgi:hypothetical protein
MPQFELRAILEDTTEITAQFTQEDVEETVYRLEDFLLACGFRLQGELRVVDAEGDCTCDEACACFASEVPTPDRPKARSPYPVYPQWTETTFLDKQPATRSRR